jgi:hypothetical protein
MSDPNDLQLADLPLAGSGRAEGTARLRGPSRQSDQREPVARGVTRCCALTRDDARGQSMGECDRAASQRVREVRRWGRRAYHSTRPSGSWRGSASSFRSCLASKGS